MNNQIDNRFVWLNDEILRLPDAKINVLAPTAQFGANVFEGIRCYWSEEQQQLFAFRLEDHHKRLLNSVRMFRMESRFSKDVLKSSLIETIRANDYREDIAVRQTIFLDGFGSWSSKGPVGMFVVPVPKARKQLNSTIGIKCCSSSWTRISDRNISPRIKAGANYVNSRMAQMEAVESGCDSAIFLNEHGKVSEGPGACLFILHEGKLVTPPNTASVLDSITRKSIIDVSENFLHLETVVRDIDRTEMYICEEAFLCGSSIEITPIGNIDGYLIGSGITGELTYAVHEAYIRAATGQLSEYQHWLTTVL